MANHETLQSAVQSVDSDYSDYGGSVVRWSDPAEAYPDCSCGCKFFLPLEGPLGNDWGVCSNSGAKRFGLLTFEHQAGHGCFVLDEDLEMEND